MACSPKTKQETGNTCQTGKPNAAGKAMHPVNGGKADNESNDGKNNIINHGGGQ